MSSAFRLFVLLVGLAVRNSKAVVAVATMEGAFPKDMLDVRTQNLVQSWDWDDYSLYVLLSQVPDPKELPEPCNSQLHASCSAVGPSQFATKDDKL